MKSHRFALYLAAMVVGSPQVDQTFAARFDDAWLPDLEYAEEAMVRRLAQSSPQKFAPAWSAVQLHMDHLVRDFASQSDLYTRKDQQTWPHNGRKILEISPENPYGMSLLIESAYDEAKPHLAEWGKKGLDFPPLLGALARRCSDDKQYDKARELLEQFIALAPEHWAYERLAADYRAQGDDAKWLATLERYVAEGGDHGLERAKTQVEIADHYMKQSKYDKARPYASAAAETGAAWAVQCAARCCEGLKDWKNAELWWRRMSERYPHSSVREWRDFCKRTGRGDLKAAQALADRYAAANPAPTANPAEPLDVGLAAWLRGSTDEAEASLTKAFPENPVVAGCALAVIADEKGDARRRDAILADLDGKYRPKAPKFFDVLKLFHDAFARGDRATPDPKALDEAIKAVAPNLRGNAEFFAGRLLRTRGDRQGAEAHLRRSIASSSTYVWLKHLASATVQRLGDDGPPGGN